MKDACVERNGKWTFKALLRKLVLLGWVKRCSGGFRSKEGDKDWRQWDLELWKQSSALLWSLWRPAMSLSFQPWSRLSTINAGIWRGHSTLGARRSLLHYAPSEGKGVIPISPEFQTEVCQCVEMTTVFVDGEKMELCPSIQACAFQGQGW